MNEQTATTAFTKKPRFIVSISGGKRRDMNATLDSLRAQTYGEWAEDAAEQSFPHDYALRIHTRAIRCIPMRFSAWRTQWSARSTSRT